MNIYIGGDSWGCGEWLDSGIKYTAVHRGIEQYFRDDGHTVVNNSIPGGSLFQIYEQLVLTNPDDYDAVILFNTLPLRDNKEWDTLLTWQNFVDRNAELQVEFYSKLASLQHKHIYILGGLEKVHKSQVDQYSNLTAVIESIPEYLTNNNYSAGPLKSHLGLIDNYSSDIHVETLDIMLENAKYWDNTVFLNTEYFHPDGYHPNRHGHYKIYNELNRYLKR